MSDCACSFCGSNQKLILARNSCIICAGCVERAAAMLREQPVYPNPYDGTFGGILEAARSAESKLKSAFLSLVPRRSA